MALGAPSLAAATGVIAVGAVLQAATGMGTGILIVPLLALIDLSLVPGPAVVASMASGGVIAGFLAAFGKFGLRETGLALLLVPGYLLGYVIARPLARILDRGYSRLAVLVLSTASAVALLIRSL